MGVGHLRRNLLIAQRLASAPCRANVLIIAGAREAGFFATTSGIDCVTLPGLAKDELGNYGSRRFRLSFCETIAVRSQIIAAAVSAFSPDLFVVDKVPRGAGNELDEALRQLTVSGKTRCVLGLREILDSPECVAREWRDSDADFAIRRYYDELWVYGDRDIYDPIVEYQFAPDVAERVQFTGYLDQTARLTEESSPAGELGIPFDQPYALCVVGGGQDGFRLTQSFLESQLPPGWLGIIVGGPFMPFSMIERLRECARRRPRMRFIESVREADWLIARAERVVGMGGYNTVCSILSFRKSALIVPRVVPRTEQFIRAQQLSRRGALDMLLPDAATPCAISDWLNRPNVASPSRARPIDLRGLDRIDQRACRLLSSNSVVSQEPKGRPRTELKAETPLTIEG